MDNEPSFAQIQGLLKDFADGGVFEFHFATTHEARVAALEKILESCFASLVENRQHKQAHSEDALSVEIVEQLRGFKLEANHDVQTGGHCDIHVRGRSSFLWIGEAKIHGGYGWLESGFKQLSTRYATGMPGQDCGDLIIYCKNRDSVSVLNSWLERLQQRFPDTSVTADEVSELLQFRTVHTCENSGRPFNTRHKIVPLFWQPSTS